MSDEQQYNKLRKILQYVLLIVCVITLGVVRVALENREDADHHYIEYMEYDDILDYIGEYGNDYELYRYLLYERDYANIHSNDFFYGITWYFDSYEAIPLLLEAYGFDDDDIEDVYNYLQSKLSP